ncbi:unnamed protein product [Allacma fusca]|uniref:Heat shock protein 70 n=1 Tax=Allacma fusca TaxID=39272 RepID=A0A8J2KW43_9HEXA|nr:unnamed protein product [Allacma fusca]
MRLKRMKTECEKQKCYLSSTKKVKISIDSIWDQKALTVSVTRDELSDLFKPYVDRCMKVVDQILANCGLKEPDIDDVMVVGGSTRIPYVQERLSEKFGGKKLIKRISQEEAVAHGAAIVAHNIENELDIIVQELEQKL